MKFLFKTVSTVAVASALLLATSSSYAAACSNDTWNKVMSRGKMVVGVKADYKPWGFRDPSGAIVGMEADMAKAAAEAMGVDYELVAVQSSNRMQFLENGKIDLMIATMSDRPDRRKIPEEFSKYSEFERWIRGPLNGQNDIFQIDLSAVSDDKI